MIQTRVVLLQTHPMSHVVRHMIGLPETKRLNRLDHKKLERDTIVNAPSERRARGEGRTGREAYGLILEGGDGRFKLIFD